MLNVRVFYIFRSIENSFKCFLDTFSRAIFSSSLVGSVVVCYTSEYGREDVALVLSCDDECNRPVIFTMRLERFSCNIVFAILEPL